MSGYRCVNYYELCRLCTASHGSKIHIFSEEGKKKNLSKKINDCLPVAVDEKDKLPKILCSQCIHQIETLSQFRETCVNAQTMLQSCLNSSKLRNGGKDVAPKKIFTLPSAVTVTTLKSPVPLTQSAVQKTPPTIDDCESEITGATQSSSQLSQNSDFLSSIIEAVGIKSVDETEQPQTQQTPQYTITLDSQSNQIQYKIEPANTFTVSETIQSTHSQNPNLASVDEFLKLKSYKSGPRKEVFTSKLNLETSSKKSKINLVLNSPHKMPHQTMQSQSSLIAKGSGNSQNVTLQDLKIISPNKCFLPIKLKDLSSDQQIMAQIDTKNLVLPTAFLQMKLQPQITTIDGQTVVQLTPTALPTTLQLSSCQTGQIQSATTRNNNPQTSTKIDLKSAPIYVSSSGGTMTLAQAVSAANAENTNSATKFQYTTLTNAITNSISPTTQNVSPKPVSLHRVQQAKKNRKAETAPLKSSKIDPIASSKTITFTSSTPLADSISSVSGVSNSLKKIKTEKFDPNQPVPVCEICNKIFKRKEHLAQHMKLHQGLRPFKCSESNCDKAFSRKEHLIRHTVSHTGKKMFNCEICQKLFSRKDNLNKHRRSHELKTPKVMYTVVDNSTETSVKFEVQSS